MKIKRTILGDGTVLVSTILEPVPIEVGVCVGKRNDEGLRDFIDRVGRCEKYFDSELLAFYNVHRSKKLRYQGDA